MNDALSHGIPGMSTDLVSLHLEDYGPSTDNKGGEGEERAAFQTAFSLPVCSAENR